MVIVGIKCPACGSYLTDNKEKDIFECEHCGATFLKILDEQDKNLFYLREKDIRIENQLKEDKNYRRSQSNRATLILGLIALFGFLFVYLHECGIL